MKTLLIILGVCMMLAILTDHVAWVPVFVAAIIGVVLWALRKSTKDDVL